MVEILSVAGRLIDGPLHGGAILRMGALEDKFQGRFHRPVTSKDSEGLVRPDDLSAGGIPAKAPGVAQSLRLGQIHFAVPQRGFNPPLIPNRCLQVISGTPESFGCLSLRRDHERDNERCDGKQDETRYLRNIPGE